MEEEAGRSEKQEEVADSEPVEDQEAGPSTVTLEKGCFDFDIFISFRGKDTRNGFTSHLYKELAETRGIPTFIDSNNLIKGGKINDLFMHIERSKIFLPVFSKNYAYSKWCLREITKMVEINKKERGKRPIIPVFYHVHPSKIKDPTASFGKAFQKHQQRYKVGEKEINEWKAALMEAGNSIGYDVPDDANGTTEAEIITRIGKRVSLSCKVPFDIQPIGREPCIKILKQKLEKEKDGVGMIGIYGLGGIGKTTLAMALYNELSPSNTFEFESCCFLKDISENGKKHGLPYLQMELMGSKVEKDISLTDTVEQRVTTLMKRRLGGKKVLLVLDDVDDISQLEALTASRGKKKQCFGAGSQIIITTRDKDVLLEYGLEEDDIHFLEGLNEKDSLQLFRDCTFDKDQPFEEFGDLLSQVVAVAQGLPLALKEFGSLFRGSRNKEEWKEKLKKLKSEQPKKVHERLKISYDGLDHSQQNVFLDIACFFIGTTKKYPVYMWEACRYFPNDTLKVLQHKSLIKINKYGRFEMHDQIRDMGRMIVEEKAEKDHRKYCRPWSGNQLLDVLKDAEATQANHYVQGIDFTKVRNEKKEMSWKVKWRMPRLRMITGANVNDRFEDIPSNIRWLDWKCCPHQKLPFHNYWLRENLCVLDLSNGKFEDFGDFGLLSKAFPNLKVLDLSGCSRLTSAPDFTHFPSLNKLVLDECCSLIKMDKSIEQLMDLVELSMVRCKKLTELPIGLCKLTSLEFLVLSGCEQILALPTQIGDLSSLKYLGLSRTSISAVPDGSFQSLEILDLTGCFPLENEPDSICGLKRLSDLSDLSLPHRELLERFPNSMAMQTTEIDCYERTKKRRREEKPLIYVRLK